MRTRFRIEIAIFVATLLLFTPSKAKACSLIESLGGKYVLSYQLTPPNPKKGGATLSYEIIDHAGNSVTDIKTISTDLWMPKHKHGSKPMQTVERSTRGHFDTTTAYFTMEGYWRINIEFETESGIKDTLVIPVFVTK